MIWTPEREALARAEAESWKGTPHKNRLSIRGRGIDCVHFVFEVLWAAGIVDRKTLPAYPISWGIAAATSNLGGVVAQALHVRRIPDDKWTPRFGDIVVFKVGNTSNHCAIIIDGRPWHSPGGGVVGPTNMEHARRTIQEAIRITKTGWRIEPGNVRIRPCRRKPGLM